MKELRHHIQLLFCLCLWMALPFTQVRGQNTSNEFVEEMHLLEIETVCSIFIRNWKIFLPKLDNIHRTNSLRLTKSNSNWHEMEYLLSSTANNNCRRRLSPSNRSQLPISQTEPAGFYCPAKHIFKSQKDFAEAETFFRRRTILTLNFMKRHLNTRW